MDDKYIVVKKTDWTAMSDHFRRNPNFLQAMEHIEKFQVPDATVIRGQDVFAGPAFHGYAAAAALAGSLVDDPEKKAHCLRVADFFHERAVEADESGRKKVPD